MKVTFKLQAENGAIVAVERIIQKPYGLIAIGKVTSGNLIKAALVSVPVPGKESIRDTVDRIENQGKEILSANGDAKIGICLKNISQQRLLEHLEVTS